EHVVRLEVAMDDPGGARGLEADRDLIGDELGIGERDLAVAAELVREVLAAQPLHREERDLGAGGADLEHADDVGAVEATSWRARSSTGRASASMASRWATLLAGCCSRVSASRVSRCLARAGRNGMK